MNKIFLYVFFLSFSFLPAQEGIKFQTLPYSDLVALAKKEKKLVFIDAMASWCGPCKMMEKNIFPQPKVAEFYNANFINASFDMEKGEGRDIAQKFGVQSYPTYLFINGDGELVSRNMGYMAESLFLELGREAHAALKNGGSMRERFNKGEKDPEFLANIIRMHSSTDYEFAKQASARYFENKKTKEFTKDDLAFLFFFLKSYTDPNYRYFVENKNEIIKLIPLEQYVEYDNFYKMQQLMSEAADEKNKMIRENYFLEKAVPLVGKEEAEKALAKLKVNFFEMQNMYPEYEKAALSYYAANPNTENEELLKAAWIFAEHVNTQSSLKRAAEWAERSVMQRESAENTFILAKLYQKLGRRDEAKMFAETSLRIAKATNADGKMAEKLLTELKKF